LNGKVSDGENVQQHFVGTLKKEWVVVVHKITEKSKSTNDLSKGRTLKRAFDKNTEVWQIWKALSTKLLSEKIEVCAY
jgi:hypothetical protein